MLGAVHMSIKSKDMTMEERRSRVLELVKPYKIGGTLADNILENGVGRLTIVLVYKWQDSFNLIFCHLFWEFFFVLLVYCVRAWN